MVCCFSISYYDTVTLFSKDQPAIPTVQVEIFHLSDTVHIHPFYTLDYSSLAAGGVDWGFKC